MSKRKEILSALRDCARRMFPNGEGKAFLFGSRARGDASDFSDWDILVITEDRMHTSDDFSNYAFPYAEVGYDYSDDRYAGSYAHDEAGYSDDDIDSVFDGDPEAYWNID